MFHLKKATSSIKQSIFGSMKSNNPVIIQEYNTAIIDKDNKIFSDITLSPETLAAIGNGHTVIIAQLYTGLKAVFNLTTHPPQNIDCYTLDVVGRNGEIVYLVKTPALLTQEQIKTIESEVLSPSHMMKNELGFREELSNLLASLGVVDHDIAFTNDKLIWKKDFDE